MQLREFRNLLDLSLAEQARRSDLAQAEGFAGDDIYADRSGKARRLIAPSLKRTQAPLPNPFGNGKHGPLTAGDSSIIGPFENAHIKTLSRRPPNDPRR